MFELKSDRTSRLVTYKCNGYGVGLAIEMSQVQLPAAQVSSSDFEQVVHTCISCNKQYNLVKSILLLISQGIR